MSLMLVRHIDDVQTISMSSFDKALKLGYIIYYNQTSELTILNAHSFEKVPIKEQGSSSYEVFNGAVYLKYQNVIKYLNLDTLDCSIICSTLEKNIRVLNSEYCQGGTSSRKPRIKRNEIIKVSDNSIMHRWSDNKGVLSWNYKYPLFETKNGSLIFYNIFENSILWEIQLDNGSFGKRILGETKNIFYLQRAVSKPNIFNVLALEKSTGKIIWETKNTHSHYCFDEVNHKLYGLSNKRFEAINTLTGEKQLITELAINVFISSHLTYYNNGLLYFSSHLENNIPVFGAVNVKTGTLDFIQKIKIEGEKSFRIGLEKPIVSDDILYVKDSLNTLHIFEKELEKI